MSEHWRVIDGEGKTHVAPTPRESAFETYPAPWTYDGDKYGLWRSPSAAVAAWASNEVGDVREIVPPGKLTADERVAAEREACVTHVRGWHKKLLEWCRSATLVEFADVYRNAASYFGNAADEIVNGAHITTQEVTRDEA